MYIFQDFKRISLIRILWGIFIGNTYRAVFLYRLSSWCYNHRLKPLGTFFWSLNIALHSCDISPKAKVGSGFRIYHSVGIVIGEATIGENLRIFSNVTIGSISSLKNLSIGDNVHLNSGCCILAQLGDNVTVGANSVVLKDVPSFYTAVGIPARIIKKDEHRVQLVY
jgi:serine O-acetyltransferase